MGSINKRSPFDKMEFEPLSLGNDVIEFDMMGLGDIDHSVDHDDVLHDSPPTAIPTPSVSDVVGSAAIFEPYIPEGDTNLEPYEGMEFESEEASKAFYNSYARRTGFSTRVSMSRRSRRDGAIIQRSFVCAREGFRVDKHGKPGSDREGRVKRPRPETRVGCKAMLVVKIQDSGKWVVSAFVKEHNHELVPPERVHCLRSHRHVSGAGIGPRGIMSALVKEYGGIKNIGFTERDCRNYMRSSRQRTLGGDTQLLLDYLKDKQAKDPAFFFAVQGDEDQCMSNVFWADPKARTDYTYFGDTVTFDTTYRSNRYRLPFAPFTGQCPAGLHSQLRPEHDRVISLAITQVFPDTRHRFCKWHIFKECQEKLSYVHCEHSNFEAELHKFVNLTESVEEFESCWLSLIDKYDLREHQWLQLIYADRRQWVPVYLRDTFFAEISITQRSDSMNSYFDGYVNASTTLLLFVKQYEKALESRYEKEVKADYDTINTAPILKTPSPMEKQAAGLYTRKMFMKFQEELVETLTFLAMKVEDEEAGSIYQVTNVLTLPPHYILKRWTRNAKSGVILEERASDLLNKSQESLTVRYNNLRHEALKYVDEGVKTVEIYNVSMDALEEAANRVSLAKKNDGRLAIISRAGRDDGFHLGSRSNTFGDHKWGFETLSAFLGYVHDEQDKKIQKLERQLDRAQRKCELYRASLLSVLKDIEEQKLQLSVKVENIKLGMKESSIV
ncbi:FAR1-related sequence 5 [Prunus dulcis]|uniref:Protein FAR1-RELATED SEQUENCE n=1 Tax=Prunus dulcis TaxID=3755 RepID=A0A4Y1RUS3_PRUDU|nr:FAR1-related sequence 5 [Prunus dulcis]